MSQIQPAELSKDQMPHGGRKSGARLSVPGTSLSDITLCPLCPQTATARTSAPPPWMAGEMSAVLCLMTRLTGQKSQLPTTYELCNPGSLNLSWPEPTDLAWDGHNSNQLIELIGRID